MGHRGCRDGFVWRFGEQSEVPKMSRWLATKGTWTLEVACKPIASGLRHAFGKGRLLRVRGGRSVSCQKLIGSAKDTATAEAAKKRRLRGAEASCMRFEQESAGAH